ncbi:hypothetical protein AB0J42_22250 [Nonomuraea sp. NPDC049649]|uniref:hypothetical protein n=1 Tax=Nonomuraea sp. NPDC049649 TaxID=3155776 RepID=UPI00343805E5
MDTILVTGATGNVGRHVVSELARAGGGGRGVPGVARLRDQHPRLGRPDQEGPRTLTVRAGGAAYPISGPELLTQAEQVRIIGEVVGREVRWEDQPPEEAREHLLAAWGDAGFVESALAGWRSFVDSPEEVTDVVEKLLGRPALPFRSWVRDHEADFR